MPPEFVAVELVGAVVSLAGVVCLVALPLPDYHWYTRRELMGTRVIQVLLLGFCTTLVFLASLWNLWFHGPSELVGFAFWTGLPMSVLLFPLLRMFLSFYPTFVTQARRRMWGANLMPIGMLVQVVACLLGQLRVHI
jgi:hypothetical protein